MVTKQQQLEWLARVFNTFPFSIGVVFMSKHDIGDIGYFGYANFSHAITRQEWQQEQDKMQKKAEQVAQTAPDNSWHERGEFPPAGCECEAFVNEENKWVRFEVIAIRDGFVMGWCRESLCGFQSDEKSEFRPIRTEREKAIDEMLSVYAGKDDGKPIHPRCKLLAEMLYDAGYRKVNP